jgi:hypothetical protein
MQDLYLDFISDHPDYAPKAKMAISRTKFYRWLKAYGLYLTNQEPDEGRDANGRWIIIHSNKNKENTINIF